MKAARGSTLIGPSSGDFGSSKPDELSAAASFAAKAAFATNEFNAAAAMANACFALVVLGASSLFCTHVARVRVFCLSACAFRCLAARVSLRACGSLGCARMLRAMSCECCAVLCCAVLCLSEGQISAPGGGKKGGEAGEGTGGECARARGARWPEGCGFLDGNHPCTTPLAQHCKPPNVAHRR